MVSNIPERGGELGLKLVANMAELTHARHGQLALDNAYANAQFLSRGKSLAALRQESIGEGDSAIVVAAGPSMQRQDPARQIRESGYKGAVIATESAIYYCLRNGIVPHLAVSLDPHQTRIVRWFGDPSLDEEARAQDDYYRRQDMDERFADELAANREIMELLARRGKEIRIALSTSTSEKVVRRVLEIGMQVYWWNPMLDDPDGPDSITRKLQRSNGLPSVNAGGNVGSACWMMASAVLGKTCVAVTGMDFGYYDDTPYEKTQYYREALDLVGRENLDALYIRVHNPYTNTWFFTDPAYMWYREAFLEMTVDADCETYNCTEGGILFGDPIKFVPLSEFLERHS